MQEPTLKIEGGAAFAFFWFAMGVREESCDRVLHVTTCLVFQID
jgi:hypothetical protein